MATYNANPVPLTVESATKDPRLAMVAFVGSFAPSPPVFGSFAPPAGAVSRVDGVAVEVTDADGFGQVLVWVEYASGESLLAYDGSFFLVPFTTNSSVSGTTTKLFFVARNTPGHPDDYVLHVTAADTQGATASASASYTLTDPPTAPAFGSFAPAAGAVSRTDAVDFSVTDSDGFVHLMVWAVLGDGTTVVVYDGSAFGPQVDDASSVSGTTTKDFSVTYNGDGWTDDYTLHALAVDGTGATSTASSAYTLTDPPAPPDVVAPVLSNVTPIEGTTITRSTAFEFDVTDNTSLSLIVVLVLYEDTGDYEVAFDGTSFAPKYASKSTRTSIAGGYHYKLVRTGGWLAAPTFKVRARDTLNNEA